MILNPFRIHTAVFTKGNKVSQTWFVPSKTTKNLLDYLLLLHMLGSKLQENVLCDFSKDYTEGDLLAWPWIFPFVFLKNK